METIAEIVREFMCVCVIQNFQQLKMTGSPRKKILLLLISPHLQQQKQISQKQVYVLSTTTSVLNFEQNPILYKKTVSHYYHYYSSELYIIIITFVKLTNKQKTNIHREKNKLNACFVSFKVSTILQLFQFILNILNCRNGC